MSFGKKSGNKYLLLPNGGIVRQIPINVVPYNVCEAYKKVLVTELYFS